MDELFEKIGKFGRFQKTAIVVIGFISSLSSITIYSTIFTAGKPKLECFKLQGANRTKLEEACEVYNNVTSNETNSYNCEFDQT